jgi:hypothetical protein
MQLRKMVVMLSALGALSLMMTGCDGDTATAGLCTTNDDCTGNEICHPTAQVCVSTCTTSNDCPANAKNCQPLAGASVSVCECQTTQQCNLDRDTADQVCSIVDEVCVTACAQDTDCPSGRTCDTATGQCGAPTNTDPCNGECTANETCDTTGSTPTCRPTTGGSCQGTAQSTCAYGEFCSVNQCTPAPVAETNSCANFSANRPAWSPTTGSGPVIYSITAVKNIAQGNQTCQSTQNELHLSVRAYRTDQDWPETASGLGLGGFFYVETNTSRNDIIGDRLLVPTSFGGGYFRDPNNPKVAEFRYYLCPRATDSSISVGTFFTGGNPVCSQFTLP